MHFLFSLLFKLLRAPTSLRLIVPIKRVRNNVLNTVFFLSLTLFLSFSSSFVYNNLYCSYGLLGASGCGKTTLLSCIVGQKKMQEGHISVLGTNMNSHSAATLGPRIGYMPQDIALVNELSIKETIFYFGRIYGMNEDRIRERFKILKDLLELPDSDRMIEKLSGGQKRRVSFACALVHGKYRLLYSKYDYLSTLLLYHYILEQFIVRM